MFKRLLSQLFLKIESKMSHRFKETIFRNVYLYPIFILILQLPILATKHIFYSIVMVPLALLSLVGYAISLKRRVICQVEYAMMLCLLLVLTLFSYIGYFVNDELYNYMFIFLNSVGIIVLFNILMMYTGSTNAILNHYALEKFVEDYGDKDLIIFDQIMKGEYIIARYIFSTFKDLYKNYLPTSGLYIGIDYSIQGRASFGDYRVADNYLLDNSYSLIDLIRHINISDIDVSRFSREDFEVFKMTIY